MSGPLLQINNLITAFNTERGKVRAVDGISLEIGSGEVLGVVGESGCGKSVTALSILGLVAKPPGEVVAGEILFGGRDLLKMSEPELRKVRGAEIAMIFQEPMTSLNPVFTVGNQITEVLRLHQRLSSKLALARAKELLAVVGIPRPEYTVGCYPHELSGGMRQRVMIAMALACRPKLLIADEPTTALDVTIQAQILELLRKLRGEFGMSVMLISHNLGVMAELADRVVVMYAGRIVESATMQELYANPQHPYTQGLYASLPSLHTQRAQKRLHSITGMVPDLNQLPVGCKFRPRCPKATEKCDASEPLLRPLSNLHQARCIYAE